MRDVMRDTSCSVCNLSIENAGNGHTSGGKTAWICPAYHARVVTAGPDPGSILKVLQTDKVNETENKEQSETYEIYYRDYKEKKTYFFGVLPERRKNGKRDRSLASIVRWGRVLFKGTVRDPNGIFALRRIRQKRSQNHRTYQ